jgi:hypothetical protein
MEVLFLVLGLLLVSLPLALVVFAWKSARLKGDAQLPWRIRLFSVALIGGALDYLWFWIAFLFLPSLVSFEAFRVIGWVSESLAVVCLALSFAGTGATRLFAVMASAGVAVLWVSVGVCLRSGLFC